MTRQNATNFTAPLQFPYANAGTDVFMKEDVQVLAQAVDQHNHTSGKGLPLAAGAIPAGTITSAMIADGTITGTDIATGAITTTQIADGTIATADLANNAVTNAKLGTDTARLNLLTNGGFEIWQRGVGPGNFYGQYLADRWLNNLGGSSAYTVSRISSTIGSAGYSQQVVYTHVAGGYGQHMQILTDGITQMGNKTVSFSIHVKSSVVGGANVVIMANNANAATKFNAQANVDETISITTTLPASLTQFAVEVVLTTSGTYEFNDAMLVVGSVAADYAPLHPADDLARCLRYYEIVFAEAQGIATAASQSIGNGVSYAAKKAVSPTLTKVGTWGVTNAGQPTIVTRADGFLSGFSFVCASVAAGPFNTYISAAGQYITSEANP